MMKTTGLLVVLALLASGCQKSAPPVSVTHAITGTWRVAIQFESGDFAPIKDLQFMTAFHQGGTLTESSNYDGAPPVPPAYGIWRDKGNGAYEAKYEFFVTRPPGAVAELTAGGGWLPAGRGVLTEEIQLSADGRTYASKLHYAPYDSLGQPRVGGGDAQGIGARIEF